MRDLNGRFMSDTNRYVTMTSGDVWALLDIESVSEFNSETGDIFTTVYRDIPFGNPSRPETLTTLR